MPTATGDLSVEHLAIRAQRQQQPDFAFQAQRDRFGRVIEMLGKLAACRRH